MRVDERKRLISRDVMEKVAGDILNSVGKTKSWEESLAVVAGHLEGVIDAHCILLQRALCVHCKSGVPLVYVEKWGEYLHNGELTCIASKPCEIMGLDPSRLHVQEEPDAR